MTSVELDHVAVTQRRVAILRGIDLRAESGTVLGLIGPSGSGKTSALRVIAGIDRQSSGTVRFDGVDVTDRAPRERNVAMVFQSPALVPSRSVARNIAFPLELRRATAEEIRRRVGAEARALHIEALLERWPDGVDHPLVVDSPAGVAAEVALVLTSLPGPVEVEQVATGPDGLAGANGGLTWFDLSTNSPTVIQVTLPDSAPRDVARAEAAGERFGEAIARRLRERG